MFIKLTKETGDPIIVNVDHVTLIEPTDKYRSIIYFDDGDVGTIVDSSLDELYSAIKGMTE